MLPDCESAEAFFQKAGPLPTGPDDIRRFPRHYFRSTAKATIYPPPGSGEAGPVLRFVLTRDLSRSGIGILVAEPLLPGQRLEIALSGQMRRWVEVMWCRRLSDEEHLCGCKFIRPED